ncbi:MAG: hypothetical protein ACHQ6U_13065 [Thermodesulfobacteriota bacterium]
MQRQRTRGYDRIFYKLGLLFERETDIFPDNTIVVTARELYRSPPLYHYPSGLP